MVFITRRPPPKRSLVDPYHQRDHALYTDITRPSHLITKSIASMTTPLARASSLVSPFVRRSTSTRSFASVRGAEVSSVYGKREHGYDAPPSPSDISTASTLLEDMPEHGTAREDGLPPFVVSRDRGFLPRKVSHRCSPEKLRKAAVILLIIVHSMHDTPNALLLLLPLGPSC